MTSDTPTAADAPGVDRRATWCAYGFGLLVAVGLGHFLLGLPIQVSDSFGNMQKLSASWAYLLEDQFNQRAFLRPFLWAELKLVYDLSAGNYTAWFRWTHVMQVFVLVGLFLMLVRPRTWRDAACVPLGLGVLVGVHTFDGTVREAFPINTYMTLLVLCFAAAVIAVARYRWWNDALAAVLFVVAALTVETGLLVWVIFIGAALIGARGVSRVGLAALVLLLGGYFYARFALLDVGSPNLLERSSGFGFGVLDPPDLIARFGDNPLPFYAYNVAASVLSVLFSEPTAGVFRITRAASAGELSAPMVVNLVASAGLVLLLVTFAWSRRREWLARRFEHDDRLVLVFGMVLVANAVISYPYTKDVIMSPAGAFLAAAGCAAARHCLGTLSGRIPVAAATALVAAASVVGSAWALRAVGLHASLRHGAVVERLDWAYIESDIAEGSVSLSNEAAQSLMRTLKEDALVTYPAPPPLAFPFEDLIGQR